MFEDVSVIPIQSMAVSTRNRMFNAAGFLNTNALQPSLDDPQMAVFATLRDDEWREVDATVVDVATRRLNGIMDLRNMNLIRTLGGIGTLLAQYEKQGDMTDADINMRIEAPGDEDKVEWELASVPVPVVHKNFRIDARSLDASRRMGSGLDVTQAAVATRKVAEGLEDLLFNGSGTIVVNGQKIHGYTTEPNRNALTGGRLVLQRSLRGSEKGHHHGPEGQPSRSLHGVYLHRPVR